MNKLLIALGLFALASSSAWPQGKYIGNYPNASALTSTDRILESQGSSPTTCCAVNATPVQLATFLATPGNLFPSPFTSGYVLSNNGSSLEWIPSTGTPGGSSYSIQYNNAGSFAGLLPGSTGVYCFDWTSLTAAPTLTNLCPNAFSALTSGTNTSAAMLVGSGASLEPTGSGIIEATILAGSPTSGEFWGYNGTIQGWYTPAGAGNVSTSGSPTQYQTPAWASSTTILGIGPGTSGQCYMSNGASSYASFQTCPSAPTFETNGTNNASQSALNIENGQGITCSNPSSGNVQCETTQPGRTVTGTTDTISCTSDAGGVILYNSSSAVAVSVPQATSSCGSGFGFTIENAGAGTATLTPTTSTIQGLSSLAIPTNSGCSLWSDGTNYQVASCRALETLTYAEGSVTTVTPNCAFGTTTATITGAATIDTPTGCTPYNGQRIFLEIQSASSETYTASGYITGSTTGAWPASSTGSSKDDHFELIYDGYLSSPGWTLAAYNLGL